MRKRNFQSVGFLIFALAVVVALIAYLETFQRGASMLPKGAPPVPEKATVTTIGTYYYNTLQGFSLRMPNLDWRMTVISETDSLPPERVGKTVFDNAVPMLEVTRVADSDTIALVEVGVVRQTIERDARDVAIQALAEIMEEYETEKERINLSKEVTVPRRSALRGAYFMIVLPESAGEKLPVWVFSSIVRDGYSYVILCRTDEQVYPEVRQDFERIIQSFRFLQEHSTQSN